MEATKWMLPTLSESLSLSSPGSLSEPPGDRILANGKLDCDAFFLVNKCGKLMNHAVVAVSSWAGWTNREQVRKVLQIALKTQRYISVPYTNHPGLISTIFLLFEVLIYADTIAYLALTIHQDLPSLWSWSLPRMNLPPTVPSLALKNEAFLCQQRWP